MAFFFKGRMRRNNYVLLSILVVFILIMPTTVLLAQDEYEEEYESDDEASEVFWGDQEDEYYDEDEYLDEEEYFDEDEYLDEYYEDEEYYEEGEGDEYYYDEGYEDEEFDEEAAEEGDVSDVELADLAKRMGFTISFTGASPGFVNHVLNTYNSSVDYRIGVEFPLLLQMLGVRFRFGAEIGTFKFENYQPIGGDFSGTSISGILSFPAGPGQVKLGGGLVGNRFGFFAETSYGLALGNTLEVRVGVRSTTVSNVKDSKENNMGTVSWMDGLIILGFNL